MIRVVFLRTNESVISPANQPVQKSTGKVNDSTTAYFFLLLGKNKVFSTKELHHNKSPVLHGQ